MISPDLDLRFGQAIEEASKMQQALLPQDVQLRLYAYFKQATSGKTDPSFNSTFDLRNAFKVNAWMQVRHLSIDESKEKYIQTINSILNN